MGTHWSRMSPMIFAQSGQLVSESKESGMVNVGLGLNSVTSPVFNAVDIDSFQSPRTPHNGADAPGA
jgi:hypothetical protein